MYEKYDVISFGEALIDFTDIGIGKNGMKIFEQNPGGAPANVACACAKLALKPHLLLYLLMHQASAAFLFQDIRALM